MDKGLIVHALIVNADGEVLLIKRSETEDVLPGVWDIPGGTLEDGEDPKDGATREVKEETNLEVRNLCLFH
ncbi:MAG: NUDIX domain-containing protein, partial [Candidatus Moraniibacteriota bacterium]